MYFWNGCTVKELEKLDCGRTLVQVLEDHRLIKDPYNFTGMVSAVETTGLHTLCNEKFKIGDHVKTCNTLQGTVTAFEMHSNRVVVVSDAIQRYQDKKIRYTYTVNELSICTTELTFVVGKSYSWNHFKGDPSLAVECPGNNTHIMLVSRKGKVVAVLPIVSDKHELAKLGFRDVKER